MMQCLSCRSKRERSGIVKPVRKAKDLWVGAGGGEGGIQYNGHTEIQSPEPSKVESIMGNSSSSASNPIQHPEDSEQTGCIHHPQRGGGREEGGESNCSDSEAAGMLTQVEEHITAQGAEDLPLT